MRSVDELFDLAAEHRGSRDVIEDMMPSVKSPEDIASLSDDRILAGMTKAIFQAGFNWKVIENKWPGFEEAFESFDPVRWKFMSDDDLDAFLGDTRIVRNGLKIQTVRENAGMLCDLADEYGSAATCIADWPMSDFVGLLAMLHKRGSRLGGATAQYFLRFLGKDGWVMGRDVVAGLVRESVIEKTPTGKAAQQKVQDAFNAWSSESGRPFAHISAVLALSIGPNL